MNGPVVDLFAGAGGWDLGARAVGIDPVGVENWQPAIETRKAADLATCVSDLSALEARSWIWPVSGLIASPPCPDWSAAGSRAKRDGKTGSLVDVPMAWARALRPRWLAWEQVPPALEVWEVNADELRSLGYSVWTGVLNAANYGVPQTRERAFLLASLDKPALPPEPTHARAPEPSLFGPELAPWVTMADVLGYGPDHPATTVAGDPRISPRTHHNEGEQGVGAVPVAAATDMLLPIRLELADALALQTFPADYPVQGTKCDQFKQVGNAVPPLLAERILSQLF